MPYFSLVMVSSTLLCGYHSDVTAAKHTRIQARLQCRQGKFKLPFVEHCVCSCLARRLFLVRLQLKTDEVSRLHEYRSVHLLSQGVDVTS